MAVLLCGLLLFCITGAEPSPWRPCTDLLPIDFLSRVLPVGGEPMTGVRMVQSGGARGFKMSGSSPRALSLPASQIFTSCGFFPAEFSIIITLKALLLAPETDEYLFTLLKEDSDLLLIGLRLSVDRLHFLCPSRRGKRHMTFRSLGLADGQWHTLVLAVTGHYATLTIDCSMPIELSHGDPFPDALNTEGSRFFIGSRRKLRGLFTGVIRQLVLLPGSDASVLVCPSLNPRLASLSLHPALLHLPIKPSTNKLPLHPYEAEVRVTAGAAPPCGDAQEGQLWFSTERRGLFLCDGNMWLTILQEKVRLDYVEDYQDLFTNSETFDMELFHIPSMGLFAAAANRAAVPGSGIYKWTNGRFELFQNISTNHAQAWKYFTIGKKRFLVVANSRGDTSGGRELSVIYKWSCRRQRFLLYQMLRTHSARDWEAFHIQKETFLAVANHRREDNNHNIDSVIYKWNPGTKIFEVYQMIRTSGAYDWEFFTVGPYHFLVVANTFNGLSTHVASIIYIWLGGIFQPFQYIMTVGATDWEMFQIGSRVFLAVANGQMLNESGRSIYTINSTIYELNMTTKTFIKFQDITTNSAVDWEFFTVGEEKFLVVANSYDGKSYSQNSVIYRWQGAEGFVALHRLPTVGCRDWEFFSTTEGSYLIYSSATAPLSKVLKLKSY